MGLRDDISGDNLNQTTKALLQTILVAAFLVVLVLFSGSFLIDNLQLPRTFWVVILAGAAGGLVQSLIQNDRSFVLCVTRIESQPLRVSWALGSLGDAVIGIGGGLALMFLFGGTLNVNFEKQTSAGLVLLTSVSFVAGVVARPLIERASETLLSRVDKADKKAEDAKKWAAVAKSYCFAILARGERAAKRFEAAQTLIDDALKLDPSNGEAHLEKGRISKQLAQKIPPPADARKKMEEALYHASEASKIQPTHDAPWFNMACYQALMGGNPDKALGYLKKAVDICPANTEGVWKDHDLDSLHALPEFERIVGPKPPEPIE